jgi:hypothetical protein
MRDQDRHKGQNAGGTNYRQSRGETPATQNSRPAMEGLLSALTEAARQRQSNSAQRPVPLYPRETPRSLAYTGTQRPPITPATPPPTRTGGPKPAPDDRQFIIVGSALPASDAWYRKHLACRYIRSLAGPHFVEGRDHLIPDTVARIKAKGHVDVQVKYGPADSGERLSREWARIHEQGEDACRDAVRRERMEPR